LEPDYNLPYSVVFAQPTYASIKVRNDVEILRLVSVSSERDYNLPSWAVDFNDTSELVDANQSLQPVLGPAIPTFDARCSDDGTTFALDSTNACLSFPESYATSLLIRTNWTDRLS
jgi:hypothetical protein